MAAHLLKYLLRPDSFGVQFDRLRRFQDAWLRGFHGTRQLLGFSRHLCHWSKPGVAESWTHPEGHHEQQTEQQGCVFD